MQRNRRQREDILCNIKDNAVVLRVGRRRV
jgi:hypothetical protein